MALGAGAVVSAVQTASMATSFVAFAVRAEEEHEGTVGDGFIDDKTLGGWSTGGVGDKNLVAPPALVVVGMVGGSKNSAAPPAKLVNGMRRCLYGEGTRKSWHRIVTGLRGVLGETKGTVGDYAANHNMLAGGAKEGAGDKNWQRLRPLWVSGRFPEGNQQKLGFGDWASTFPKVLQRLQPPS